MKAWILSSDDQYEGTCEIVFAETRGKARASRGDAFHDIDFHRIDVRRAPKFDGRESNPPTLKELVTMHGWTTECESCGSRCGEDANPVWSSGHVSRCDNCDDGTEV